MIAHVSIPAQDPKNVARLLAKIMDGKAFNFPVVPGALIVIAKDGSGSAIEVYPAGMTHHPGKGNPPLNPGPATMATQEWEDQIYMEKSDSKLSSHHMAIVSRLSEGEIIELGQKHKFRAVPCDRAGVFKLVELWIDNHYLIEVLIETEAQRYKNFMNPRAASEMFGPALED